MNIICSKPPSTPITMHKVNYMYTFGIERDINLSVLLLALSGVRLCGIARHFSEFKTEKKLHENRMRQWQKHEILFRKIFPLVWMLVDLSIIIMSSDEWNKQTHMCINNTECYSISNTIRSPDNAINLFLISHTQKKTQTNVIKTDRNGHRNEHEDRQWFVFVLCMTKNNGRMWLCSKFYFSLASFLRISRLSLVSFSAFSCFAVFKILFCGNFMSLHCRDLFITLITYLMKWRSFPVSRSPFIFAKLFVVMLSSMFDSQRKYVFFR